MKLATIKDATRDGQLAVVSQDLKSAALADDIAAIGLPRDKIALHYTGLDRDRFRPLQHAQLRRRLARELAIGLPDTAPILATVGALIPRKGQALVIEALSHLPGDTVLLLVGRGEDEAALRSLAHQRGAGARVYFLGSLDHERVMLERKIDELRAFERDYRNRMKSYLESQLRDLESRNVQLPTGRPAASAQPQDAGFAFGSGAS